MKHIASCLCALLCAVLILSSCSDDMHSDEPDAAAFGSQRYVELPADISAILPQGETTIHMVYEESKTPMAVKASHYVRDGKSVIDFGTTLRQGSYVLGAASTRDADGIPQESHLGCMMRVEANTNSIYPSTFDMLARMFGSGTPDDPYRIASARGLKLVRELLADGKRSSKDLCFLQLADIDMTRDYNKGFRPIADKSAYPFEGSYDGGGHSIYYCAVRTLDGKGATTTDVVPATGLFGYVAGATFRNLTLVDPVSIGAGSTGTLIGAVVGISGVDQTATVLRNIRVRKQSSTASEVYGTNFVGGIVGGVDANAVLMMTACVNENLPVSNSKDGSFIGGLVGGGTVNATAVLDSCVNHAPVSAYGTRCAGGVIGGVEAACISNSINYGKVNASACMGVGGIAGGLGTSSMAAVVNQGDVIGDMGTGGILGSTVMRRDDGSFNDIIMTSGHNYATVRGGSHTGGIVGEAQASLSDCYNRGPVISSGTFAGGIIGFSPVAVIHASYNNSSVNALQGAGGVAGRAAYYIFTDNANLAPVTSSAGMAAGILALGGSTGMINFCANYGSVNGTDISAGIIARAGDSYSLDKDDVTSLIESYGKTTHKVVKANKTPPAKVSDFKAKLNKGKKVMKIFTSTKDLVTAIATPIQLDDLDYWDSLYAKQLPERNEALLSKMHSDIRSSMPKFSFTLSGMDALPLMVYDNMVAFDASMQGDDDDDRLADAIHDRLADIDEQVAKVEKAREILLAASSCVLAVAGMVLTGGAATSAMLVCSAAVATVGSLSQRVDNCVEISQCCNFGTISAGDDGYGICARLGDHVRLQDCFSAGVASGYGVSDKSEALFDDICVRRTVSVGVKNQHSFSNGDALSQYGNFSLVADDYIIGGSRDTGMEKAERLAKKSTYVDYQSQPYDFDDHKYWTFMIPAVPTPYNNLYFPFR